MVKAAWLVLTLVIAVGVAAEESAKAAPQIATQQATGNLGVDSGLWTFQLDQFRYSLRANGRGSRRGGEGAPLRFQLPLDKGDRVEYVRYVRLGQDLGLLYGVTDGDGAAGRIVRLDGNSLKALWTTRVPGFNLGEAVVEGDYLYVTAIGFVAKLDLTTGRYVWQHRKLYAGGHFNAFERPEVGETLVIFSEKLQKPELGPARAVRVQKLTGDRVPE